MKVELKRIYDDKDTTVGTLFLDGKAVCFIVEDQAQTKKVYAETRIPAGVYKMGIRKSGSFHERYSRNYPDIHKGMIAIYNRPNYVLQNAGMTFQYILLHIGNHDDNTAGCLLPNLIFNFGTMRGSSSTQAYKKVYPKLIKAIEANGGELEITITDEQ